MMRLFLALSFLMLLLSGCSSVNKEPPKATLGDIKTLQPAINYSTTEVDEVDLIKSYRELLKIAKTNEQDDGATLKRLSDISLESSIDDLLSEDETTILKGKALSNEAIKGYNEYLTEFPNKDTNDEVLYQLAKVYDINGETKKAFNSLLRLDDKHPNSKYISEVKFRIAEHYFSNNVYPYAKEYYKNVIDNHKESKFYRNALYKYAWSLIKNNENEASIYAFLDLMDLHYSDENITETHVSPNITDSQQTLIRDVLRAINLAINYDLEDVKINHYFKQAKKPYEPLIYESLAQHLVQKNRITDAANVYFTYLENNQPTYTSFQLFNRGVTLLKPTAFTELYLKSKKAIVNIYTKSSIYKNLEPDNQVLVRPILSKHNYELAEYYHSLAQTPKQKHLAKSHYQLAEKWYSLFLQHFSGDPRYGKVSFLLAETFTERGLYLQAAKHYSFSSYQIKRHKQSKEAGYAAVISYKNGFDKAKKDDDKYRIKQQLIDSSIAYRENYDHDKRSDNVIYNAITLLYDDKRYSKALDLILPLLNSQQTSAWLTEETSLLAGHSYFNQRDFLNANTYYLKALNITTSTERKQLINTKLGESYYELATLEANNKQHIKAANLYLSAEKASPKQSVKKIALYDAATQYLLAEDWQQSINLLKRFQKVYKNDIKLYKGSQEKVALAYRNMGDTKQASFAVLALANNSNKKEKQALLWEAATLFKKDNNTLQYLKAYDYYAKNYPIPLERSLLARQTIADYHLSKNDIKLQKAWLNSIVKNEKKYTKDSNQEANKIAADSSLALAKYALNDYQKLKLTVPLKQSLAKKRKALKTTIKQFSNTLKYTDPHTQTLAAYGLGEIYRDFASSLLNSERPKNLNKEELEEYGYLLEDQAFPFEEKAIKIHRSNFAKTQQGIYNQGIKQSHSALSKLLPFQYDKHEIKTPYVTP